MSLLDDYRVSLKQATRIPLSHPNHELSGMFTDRAGLANTAYMLFNHPTHRSGTEQLCLGLNLVR